VEKGDQRRLIWGVGSNLSYVTRSGRASISAQRGPQSSVYAAKLTILKLKAAHLERSERSWERENYHAMSFCHATAWGGEQLVASMEATVSAPGKAWNYKMGRTASTVSDKRRKGIMSQSSITNQQKEHGPTTQVNREAMQDNTSGRGILTRR